ncbi:aminoglycoside phosphotransferase family protein [Isoptericola jiangsuensis]|uniref:aminoglycoside phosphotransferase family protein n=1 Tax=Isoptericola jiangsuensis TaxID=548579 RepID=UPI003AAE13D1
MSPWSSVPAALRASHLTFYGDAGTAWDAAAPALAARFTEEWRLAPDGPTTHGGVAWILPVRRSDGTPATLKLQPLDAETAGEPTALRAWAGDGAVRLLEHDPDTGAMLLERLDDRSLADVPDDVTATEVIAELLAHLHRHPAPDGLRRLDDVLASLLERADAARGTLRDAEGNDLLDRCAAVGRELAGDAAGETLLHWDLHCANVLASREPERGSWLAIDPKPLVGDPGYELLAPLHNRWDDLVRGGAAREGAVRDGAPGGERGGSRGRLERRVLHRFDVLRAGEGLDRGRAAAWTCVRVLENLVWEAGATDSTWSSAPDRVIARVLLPLVG